MNRSQKRQKEICIVAARLVNAIEVQSNESVRAELVKAGFSPGEIEQVISKAWTSIAMLKQLGAR